MSMHKLTSLMRRAGGARELELWARYGAGARQAHLALVRADTADAVKRFAGRRTRSVHVYPDPYVAEARDRMERLSAKRP